MSRLAGVLQRGCAARWAGGPHQDAVRLPPYPGGEALGGVGALGRYLAVGLLLFVFVANGTAWRQGGAGGRGRRQLDGGTLLTQALITAVYAAALAAWRSGAACGLVHWQRLRCVENSGCGDAFAAVARRARRAQRRAYVISRVSAATSSCHATRLTWCSSGGPESPRCREVQS